MTLIEQNEKLAKFMGWIRHEHNSSYNLPQWYKRDEKDLRKNGIFKGYPEQLKFHSSWDWLMPVVEKLESMGFALHIDEDRVFLHFPRNHEMMDFTKEECGSKIATVYKAVCAGVEWIERLDKTAKAL